LADALTILRAYVVAGRPDQGLAPCGSFEAWSAIVRSVVKWIGLPDPGETRTVLQDQADVSSGAMETLLHCLQSQDADRRSMTAAQLVELAKADKSADLRDAVESLAGKLHARLLGNKLRGFRRRIFGGLYLDRVGEDHRAVRWAAFKASEFSDRLEKTPHTRDTWQVRGECDESDESFSTGRKCEKAGPYRERF
jgi:putative DNA primase/helicase